MRCPRCGAETPEQEACPNCGVFMARYRPMPRRPVEGPEEGWGRAAWSWLRERATALDPEATRAGVLARAALLAALALWGLWFLARPLDDERLGRSFLHLIHLPFHEAGHVIFAPFGDFLRTLGGTLGQLLVPILVAGAFLQRQDPFGASVGGWWLGQSFLDCAPYINDARAGRLELLGGVTGSEMPGYHDWEVLLGRLGWLAHDHTLARFAWGIGTVILLASVAWGAWILRRQWLQSAA